MKAVKYHLGSHLFLMLFLISMKLYAEYSAPDSLKYLEHSFVQIKTSEGVNIYIDPFNVNAFKDSADIVLITHEHDDHNEILRVKQKKNCRVIRAANSIVTGVYQSFTMGNVKITAVAAYNLYHMKSDCVGYVVEFNGIKLYHSGDTGKITEMAGLANYNLDYALLCMDGIYTMTPEEATAAAAIINAKHDIPIHTMPPPDTYSNAIASCFTSPDKMIVKPGTAIELSVSSPISVKRLSEMPDGYKLNQNYPNPFNPSTMIGYKLPVAEFVSLKIYDSLAREVATLVNQIQSAGSYVKEFNAEKLSLSGGIYFYRLVSGNYSETKKLMLLK